ncbi:11-beta-hydroxysteroid dehydrogenase A-like [Aristolochia californica]|uniref:11-beta-hydroxysteroid dehydrogenase A-like n=1 Tax=Aristolochia californica TaxID=171875 RepID=UPI0035D97277
MDIIHKLINLVAPQACFFTLFLFLPPFYIYKFFISTLNALFSESMSNKVVLVTGASSGIGEHIAYQYAKKKASLALVARRENRLHEVAERARSLGSPDVLVLSADVAKSEDCKRFVQETMDHFGRLDHLVNNAGIGAVCMFEDAIDLTNFTPVMDVNFWGAIYPTHFAIPHLKKSRGRVVVNASSAGWLPMPRTSFYNASKAATISFYETLRVEFGPDIKITIVTPGWIESEMTQGTFLSKEGEIIVDQEMRDVQVGLSPVGYAEGCAKAIVNSACRGERYVTQPAWFRVLYLYRVFCPEVIEWVFRMLYITSPGASQRSAHSKKILDLIGAKKVLYPSSIQEETAVKTE